MSFIVSEGYIPGVIGRITELHSIYYHHHAGFGAFFESKVASEFAEFVRRYNHERDHIWTVQVDGHIEGAIVLDGINGSTYGVHLRWFIISDRLRGKGLGNRLIKSALEFCARRKYGRLYLWTFEGLNTARHLYEKHGFKLVEQIPGAQWGIEVREQQFEWRPPYAG